MVSFLFSRNVRLHCIATYGCGLRLRRVVRYHPSRMRVQSEQLPCHSAFEAGFDIDTSRSGDEQFDCESDPL